MADKNETESQTLRRFSREERIEKGTLHWSGVNPEAIESPQGMYRRRYGRSESRSESSGDGREERV